MRTLATIVAVLGAAAILPATASASMPLTNASEITAFQARYGLSQTGSLDGPTQACAWQRDCPPLPAAPSSPARSAGADKPICHNGILSDDAGQGCADGLYARSGHSASLRPTVTRSSGGSGNPMVNPYCESSGNSQVRSANGQYWGKYQFDYRTWVASGGSPGSYGSAPESVQDQVAGNVTYDAWPNC